MLLTQFYTLLLLMGILLAGCTDSASVDEEIPNEEIETGEPPVKEWQLVWYDEFDGEQLDTGRWNYQLGTGTDYGLNGWGNNELQYYTDREENVFLEDGKLHIVAKRENFNGMSYTSGRLRTFEKGDWVYGRIEVRARLPKGRGIWPAIWMLPTDEIFGGWPKSGEIDIMEMVGHEPETIHGTVHYGPDWPNNQHTGSPFTLDEGIFADDFHTFSIEWEQDQIKWFVDDEQYYSVTPSTLQPYQYPFNARFHLLINLAVGGNWPGNPDETTEFPQTLVVDYVRVYQLQ